MSKRVLIVAYGFPPSNQVAVHRILRLSKWLPEYGWKPIILTVSTKYAHPFFYGNEDTELNKLVPDKLEVYRAPSFEKITHPFFGKVQVRITKALAIPDSYITWVPGAVFKGKKLIDKLNIDAVLTTLGPNSTALIGYFLRRSTTAKWIMDYRDPWCPNPFKQLGRIRYYLEKKIEDTMLSRSDANVTTSNLITRVYQRNYPNIADRFFTITNCFDHELQFISEDSYTGPKSHHKFRLVHAGSFYAKRRPTSFLQALVALANNYPDIQSKIEVSFVGALSDESRGEISRIVQELAIDCQFVGAVSYKECMRHIVRSDLLLAINGIEDRDNIFIPGKLFDYMAANRPILFIGHKGAASEIVEKGNLGAVRTPDDIDGISGDIYRNYQKWELSQNFEPNSKFVNQYHASNVAKQLAGVLDSVL